MWVIAKRFNKLLVAFENAMVCLDHEDEGFKYQQGILRSSRSKAFVIYNYAALRIIPPESLL